MKRTFVALVVSATALGGGSVAWAQTAPTAGRSPSAEQQAKRAAVKACREAAAPTKDREALKACLEKAGITRRPRPVAKAVRRSVHGELVVKGKDGTFQTVQVDRGTVTSSSTTQIVLARKDGVTVTLALTSETRYRGIDGAAAIRRGEPAQVVSKDGKALGVRQGAGGNKAPGPVVPKG